MAPELDIMDLLEEGDFRFFLLYFILATVSSNEILLSLRLIKECAFFFLFFVSFLVNNRKIGKNKNHE